LKKFRVREMREVDFEHFAEYLLNRLENNKISYVNIYDSSIQCPHYCNEPKHEKWWVEYDGKQYKILKAGKHHARNPEKRKKHEVTVVSREKAKEMIKLWLRLLTEKCDIDTILVR
jgi:hypothetical protein